MSEEQYQELCRMVEQYSPMLLRAVLTRVPTTADAEDVVQDVFVRLMTKHPRFRDGEHEKAWLLRTALNRASDLRRTKHDDVPLDETIPAPPQNETYPLLLSAVRALPKRYSAVIHLYYYEGYSIHEIARLLALPAPTVGTRLARARKRLRELLKEDLYES